MADNIDKESSPAFDLADFAEAPAAPVLDRKPVLSPAREKLINEALAIQEKDALAAGEVGYISRSMVQASLPHSRVEGSHFERRNGDFVLTLAATKPNIGLPYGSIPRLLLSWVATEAREKRQRELELGASMSGFMRELGLIPTGGRWGSIPRLKDQTRRLFSTAITTTRKKIVEVGVAVSCDESFLLAEKSEFWWSPHKAEDSGRWQPTVTLSKPFYDEIIQHPVPVDLRALRALKRSPFCLDIYAWATHRKSYLKRPTEIPWEVLAQQFGGDYARLRDFKASFMAALIKVSVVYDQLDFEATERSLLLKPAAPHVARKGRLRKST